MQSMTGFGHGEATSNGTNVTVDISGINRKQLDIRFIFPREITTLEAALRPLVQSKVSRGCVNIVVNYELSSEHRREQVKIDFELAKDIAGKLKKIASETGLSETVSVTDLLNVPGVIEEQENQLPMELLQSLAKKGLEQAMTEFISMRTDEGNALAGDLRQRTGAMQEKLDQISSMTDQVLKTHHKNLRERLKQLDLEIDVNDERLAKELAFFTERSDITEELVRLKSHFNQILDSLDSPEPIGRSLEFLCQEMHRELNTLGSKTSDCGVAKLTLFCKTELGKLREQVQNIE